MTGSSALRASGELGRALGAAVLTPPAQAAQVWDALGLGVPSGPEHTAAFVLGLAPHAAIHLGAEGKLGGEGLDRVAGFWRALGLAAPEDADHLGTLLLLYGELGDGAATARNETTRERLARASAALFDEHLWSWAPGYLRAVAPLGGPAVAAWAGLTADFLGRERVSWGPPAQLPLALREAPAPLPDATHDQDELLDAIVAPVRCGVVLSHADFARCAQRADVGYRRGERRFALKAMLAQSPARVLPALAAAVRLAAEPGGTDRPDAVQQWWADRAAVTARVLDRLATDAVSGR